jgi:hypothetical protein
MQARRCVHTLMDLVPMARPTRALRVESLGRGRPKPITQFHHLVTLFVGRQRFSWEEIGTWTWTRYFLALTPVSYGCLQFL